MSETKSRILNVVVAGIRDTVENKWLLIRRERGDYIGKWALVGGKLEFGETIKEACLREVLEETNLRVKWEKQTAIINERLIDHNTKKQLKQFLIFLAETTVKAGKVKETDEGNLSWFSEEEIRNMKRDIIPSDFFMLTNILIPNNQFPETIEIDMIQNGNELYIAKIVNQNET
ncbi:MAG: NUDIX domain-containing protein [Candidatus Heimdallarchaeum aukensis]|uniref:NUDIX domain-containing protein n=1 Tax=Candidatus Heimdallarchaeum aukensis TaxID=2876573 RepID=A0A9Y1BJS2_9ARCH|nr:MAG: NUDIX domain-containing protein [Candidatus Heimdallarchaeum aukensis]